MTPFRFHDLAFDLQKQIISHISRPADLKNLCLAGKSLRELATPRLYYKVTLFIGCSKDVLISGFLSRTNPGLQHIRRIYLQLQKTYVLVDPDDENESSDSDEEEPVDRKINLAGLTQAQLIVRLLIDFLPADVLEIFSWQMWEPFSMDNWVLLCKKQRKLKVVEIAASDKPYMPVLDQNPKLLTNLTNLTSLHFYPEDLDRLQACQRTLEANPDIREMQLSSGFSNAWDVGVGVANLHDSSTQPGLIFRTIFSHMLPLDKCTPLRLRKLTLDNIDVRYAAETYIRAIDFSCLESISIGGCPGIDALFAQMSKAHIRPNRLKKLRWFHDSPTRSYAPAEPHALEAFEGLLEGLQGLVVIHVDVSNVGGLPKPSAITRHGKTLKVLAIRSKINVHQAAFDDVVQHYEQDDFNELTTGCTELRQLSVATPHTVVSMPKPSTAFKNFLESLVNLRNLVTFNIQNWPETSQGVVSRNYRLKPMALDLYYHHLQRLAQQIFEASDMHAAQQTTQTPTHLRVLAFGANGMSCLPESKVKLVQIPFVRGLRIDPMGQKQMLAVKVTWKQVGWIEPESGILNRSMYNLEDVHQPALRREGRGF